MRIIGICSLYEPLQFLENRIKNLNQCDLSDTMIFFGDCSTPNTWKQVETIIKRDCKFAFNIYHFEQRNSLYYTWAWVIDHTRSNTTYYCNTNVDDIQDPTYFKKMSGFLDTHPQIKIVACPWFITNIKGQIWPAKITSSSGPNIDKTMGHFPMWRASLHLEEINFDPRMVAVGDAFFWTKIKKKYGREAFAILNEQLCCYLTHENNLYYTAKGPNGQSGESYDCSIGGH